MQLQISAFYWKLCEIFSLHMVDAKQRVVNSDSVDPSEICLTSTAATRFKDQVLGDSKRKMKMIWIMFIYICVDSLIVWQV